MGYCTAIPTENWTFALSPQMILDIVGIMLPCIIIIWNYFKIWLKIRQSSQFLKSQGTKYIDKNIM